MRTLRLAVCCLALAALGAGCDSCSQKPSESECRAAIENMRHIRGLDQNTAGVEINKAIRSCRGSSSKKTARCLTDAKTEADLQKCEGKEGEKFVEQEREAERKRREKAGQSDDKSDDKSDNDNDNGGDGDDKGDKDGE